MSPDKSLVWLFAAALLACGPTSVVGTKATTVSRIDTMQIRGPYVPAKTELEIALDQGLSSETARVGDPFTARLTTALNTPDGKPIAPAGARLDGTITQVSDGRLPRLRLEFHTIQTLSGPAPLQASVKSSDRVLYRGNELMVMPPTWSYHSTAVYAPTFGAPVTNSMGEPFSGNIVPLSYVGRPREVKLNPGAKVRLVLLAPLIPPGFAAIAHR